MGKRVIKFCSFVSVGGETCKNSGHNCDDFKGKYIGFCPEHYEKVKFYSYGHTSDGSRKEVYCFGDYKDAGEAEGKAEGKAEGVTEGMTEGKAGGVTEGKAGGMCVPQICVSFDYVHSIWDVCDPFDVLCTYCSACYSKIHPVDSASLETIKKFTLQREKIIYPPKLVRAQRDAEIAEMEEAKERAELGIFESTETFAKLSKNYDCLWTCECTSNCKCTEVDA